LSIILDFKIIELPLK